MGLDARYILSILKKNLLRYVPKQIRKPLLLASSLLGLYWYYRMMFRFSSALYGGVPSRYLLMIGSFFEYLKTSLVGIDLRLLSVLLLGLGYLFLKHYLTNIYRELNAMIACAYLIITIAAMLPMIVG